MAILALDQGTSGSKAIVVDEQGVHAVVEKSITPEYLSGGGVEQDPMALYNSLIEAGHEAVKEAGLPIEGVSVANQGETILAWDPETGEPLTTCIVWQDRRAETVVDRLREHSDEVHERTGLVLDCYFTAPKMVWLRENLTKEGVVTTTDTWIVYKLTGKFVTDTSTASRSLIFNVDDVAWDPRLLEIFDLQDEKLPDVVPSDAIVRTTTEFGGEIPVGGLIVDQQAALLAQTCLKRGEGAYPHTCPHLSAPSATHWQTDPQFRALSRKRALCSMFVPSRLGRVHSSYLVDGSYSQRQIAKIIVGEEVDAR